jgi:hypothetical protein
MDLLLPDAPKGGGGRGGGSSSLRPAEPPRLDIKRDPKGCVSVVGATTQPVGSRAQLLAAIEQVSSFGCVGAGGGGAVWHHGSVFFQARWVEARPPRTRTRMHVKHTLAPVTTHPHTPIHRALRAATRAAPR